MIRGVRLRRRVEWGAEESRQEPILRIPCETVIEELAAMVEREKESGKMVLMDPSTERQ